MRILNRIVTIQDGGLRYESDPRHAELLIRNMGVSNSVGTPGVKDGDLTHQAPKGQEQPACAIEGTDNLAQEGAEPRTVDSTNTMHACGLASSSSFHIYGHIQSILSTDPDHHENSLHENGKTIDGNIWSILAENPVDDTRVFASPTLATKSREKNNDRVEKVCVKTKTPKLCDGVTERKIAQ